MVHQIIERHAVERRGAVVTSQLAIDVVEQIPQL
jgi:hypothetical protein